MPPIKILWILFMKLFIKCIFEKKLRLQFEYSYTFKKIIESLDTSRCI